MSAAKRPSQLLLDQIAALEKDYQKVSLAEFRAGFKDLFGRHPRLKLVTWGAEYAYNDEGGTDLYSSHEEPHINGFDDCDCEEEDEGEDLYTLGREGDKDAEATVDEVCAFLSSFPTDEFYAVHFCDGGRVTKRGVAS